MTIFLQRLKCYTTFIVKELLYNKKSNFSFYFKKCLTYINITVISNNMIKQYYGILKMFKVLVIVKKKPFSRTNILIQDRSISRIYLQCPHIKMVNSSKDGILLQFRRWSQIALSFDGLNFLNVKGDISICSPDLTFKCLSVSP